MPRVQCGTPDDGVLKRRNPLSRWTLETEWCQLLVKIYSEKWIWKKKVERRDYDIHHECVARVKPQIASVMTTRLQDKSWTRHLLNVKQNAVHLTHMNKLVNSLSALLKHCHVLQTSHTWLRYTTCLVCACMSKWSVDDSYIRWQIRQMTDTSDDRLYFEALKEYSGT